MRRFYDEQKIIDDVNQALQQALSPHGLNTYSLLGLCAVMEVIGSPFKLQLTQGKIGRPMGLLGLRAYYASRLARAVAALQSPHSIVVNQLMECMALALAKTTKPLPEQDLERDTLRIFLNKPRLTLAGMPKARKHDSSFEPAFQSARGYLLDGEVIEQESETGHWQLVETYRYAVKSSDQIL